MRETLRKLYKKNKERLIPFALFLASLFILLNLIIPQLSSIFETRKKISIERKKLKILEESLSIMNSQNTTEVNSNLQLASSALLFSKDIALVYASFTQASLKSQVVVRSFSIKVGDVYTQKKSQESITGQLPTFDVSIRLSSPDPRNIIDFTRGLYKTLPLLEIKKINVLENSSDVEVSFFYKPLDTTSLARQDVIGELTLAEVNTLNTLREFER